jgi:hypothetical protein
MNLAREKTIVFATLGTITTVLYLGTLYVPLFLAHVLTPTAVDATIPFVPLFVVPYSRRLSARPVSAVGDFGPAGTAGRAPWASRMIVVMSGVMFLFWPTDSLF